MKRIIELTDEQLTEYVILKEFFEELLEDVEDISKQRIKDILDDYGTIQNYLIEEYETPFYQDSDEDTPFDTSERVLDLANMLSKEQIKELLLHASIMNKLPEDVIL